MTSESGGALDIPGFQNTGLKTVTVKSLGLRSKGRLLSLVTIINLGFAVCVGGSEDGHAAVLLQEEVVAESEVRVVVVALLNVVNVHEFAEFLGCFAAFDPVTALVFPCDQLFDQSLIDCVPAGVSENGGRKTREDGELHNRGSHHFVEVVQALEVRASGSIGTVVFQIHTFKSFAIEISLCHLLQIGCKQLLSENSS